MEPKPESLWWTCSFLGRRTDYTSSGKQKKMWELPFVKEFDVLGFWYHRSGKGTHGVQKNLVQRDGKLVA